MRVIFYYYPRADKAKIDLCDEKGFIKVTANHVGRHKSRSLSLIHSRSQIGGFTCLTNVLRNGVPLT